MCEKCSNRVKNAFEALDEVDSVSVSLEDGNVSLELNKELSDAKIKSVIEDLGYEMK